MEKKMCENTCAAGKNDKIKSIPVQSEENWEEVNEKNWEKVKHSGGRTRLRPGVRTIDVSAVRRMITWSIHECEQQLDNLRNTLDVIDGLTSNRNGQ